MKVVRLVSVLMPLWAAACFSPGREGPGERIEIPGLARPVSLFSDWRCAEGPTEYTPETLFEYLDGEARSYRAYGFARLFHVRVARPEAAAAEIELDVFDMGSELGAYGIYSASRPREAESRPWGADGYVHETVAAAWKGRFYVRGGLVNGEPEAVEAAGMVVWDAIEAVGGRTSKPAILQAIPRTNLISNTEHYVARDLMGHAFLPGGMIARYRMGDAEALFFLSELDSAGAASQALRRLREYEAEDGAAPGDEAEMGLEGFRVESPGLGPGLVIRQDRHIAGVWGAPSPDEARELLRAVISNLREEAK